MIPRIVAIVVVIAVVTAVVIADFFFQVFIVVLIAGSSRFWRKEVLHDIMTTCTILHNMIIEDERDLNAPIQDVIEAPTPTIEMVVD
ncbi:hypothetical protein KY284_023992 [Solanum tuberosum]|nr:hypothetical protein KY284_023992 [Solanum tuberosum]